MKNKKATVSKERTGSKRPLMNDSFTQLSTMADFYAHAAKNIIPDLYMKRIVKNIKAKSPSLLSGIGVTLAFHTDQKVCDKNLKNMLGNVGDGVNFEIFLRIKEREEYVDINFNVFNKDDVISKIKADWSIPTDSGRRVFVFDFESFDVADKVFGLSLLSNSKNLSLLKEVVEFEKMICAGNFAIPDYTPIESGLSGVLHISDAGKCREASLDF